jgi:hypothetical protein
MRCAEGIHSYGSGEIALKNPKETSIIILLRYSQWYHVLYEYDTHDLVKTLLWEMCIVFISICYWCIKLPTFQNRHITSIPHDEQLIKNKFPKWV